MFTIKRTLAAVVTTVAFLAGGVGIALPAQAGSGLGVVQGAMFEFGSALRDDAADPQKAAQIPALGEKLKNASSVADLANCLLLMESIMGWNSVQDSWKDARDGWVQQVQNADSAGDLAKALLALEAATKWEAVEDGWKNQRDAWVSKLQAL